MVNYVNDDGSLVGFWPLNEPSGAAVWQNHASPFSRHPSGVCFDLTVSVADNTNIEEYMSVWPGQGTAFNAESGTFYTGYQVQGSWRLNTDSSPLSRYLILGAGSRQCTEQIWQPAVAQSGFTVGFWVYPNSDGYENFQNSISSFASTSWLTEAARSHTLLGAFQANTLQGGWRLGISGVRTRGAQFNFDETAGKQLRAFGFIERTTGSPTDLLSCPIDSGRFTHVTYSYRYIDGTNNQIALYIDGHLQSSGTTTADLVNSNSSLISTSVGRAFAIGASDDGSVATDDYERTSGWNHLVSGVYFFKRVLDEGEILDIHSQGGLQPNFNNLLQAVEVDVTDDDIIAYYPFMEPGYGDISKNHYACISNFDLGDQSERVLVPGPHNFGASFHNGTNTSNYHAVPSGACFDLLNARSWTIGTWLDLQNAVTREDNMWLSWGSVTSVTNSILQPASITLTLNTCGLVGTVSGITNAQRAVLEVYPLGDNKDTSNIQVFNLRALNEYYNQSTAHIAIAYDDSTRGLAVYVNGIMSESGTLNHSLTDQLMRITGSGFPLMFGNGIQDQIADATTKGLHTTGGLDQWLGPSFLIGRALVGPEVRGIALSGIANISRLFKTRHDPRLIGYWPCLNYQLDDVIILDEARAWQTVPGHLVRGDTFASDERWYDRGRDEPAGSVFRDDGTAFIDSFGSGLLPLELSSYGNLGITSGIFIVNGGSLGTAGVADALNARSAVSNLSARYKPVIEERDISCQNIAGEFIVGFEVTPSGNIPAIDMVRTATNNEINTNCVLFSIGNSFDAPGNGDSEFQIFLTSLNSVNPDPLGASVGLGGSGITIRVDGQADTFSAANYSPLVSGLISYGIPSKVLVHGKFEDPFSVNGITPGNSDYTISLWVNGILLQRLTKPVTSTRIWSSSTPDSADYAPISFGGAMASDSITSQANWQGGLADIYMREIFLMRGKFETHEVEALAASGIQSPSIAGFIDQLPTTQVSVLDNTLKAYWRFNGFAGGGSGTTDLSGDNNHLFPAAQRYHDAGLGFTQAAGFMRFSPAMFQNSDLLIQCSGISYGGSSVSTGVNRLAPFMASGVAFDDPNAGFSIGFFMKKKDDVATNRADVLIAYGVVPTVITNALVDYNYGWTILTDTLENTKMIIAADSGNMYMDNVAANAANSGQFVCGIFGTGGKVLEDLRPFERQYTGDHALPRLDSWSHYCWTFDPSDSFLRCYLNGQLVDMTYVDRPLQVPLLTEARYITFLQHSNVPWNFDNINTNDYASCITDVFYFNRALTEAEIRYTALNGIDASNGVEVTAVMGGYVRGQDTVSGIIGGYHRSYDNMSGIFAGYVTGATLGSGNIAGYVHGLNVGSGFIGGFAEGTLAAFDVIGGFVAGSSIGSGMIGGFILGGLQGRLEFDTGFTIEVMTAEDFDAQLEVAKTLSADFDAKLVIFQNEISPIVDILIPSSSVSGLVPPFNQYFIGVASGQQGKSITQTRWTFGDFTPTVSVAVSGSDYYPVQHTFASSGFFIAKFEAIDSNGLHASATRIINVASGIDPVIVSLSGVPRSGSSSLVVDFTTTTDILPPGVSIISSLVNFDDGQSTSVFNPTHIYTEPGTYKPIWAVRDSRGVIWCDSLENGNDFLRSGGA